MQNRYFATAFATDRRSELLDTYANIYYDGTFLGNVYLSPDQSKEDYDISLGKDEGVRLKRTQKKKYRSNVLLKGQTKTEFEYEIEITSLKAKSTKVLLKDQIPVSQDKTIVVDAQELVLLGLLLIHLDVLHREVGQVFEHNLVLAFEEVGTV